MATQTMQGRQPKNARAKRALRKREPRVIEDVKNALVLKGHSSSSLVNGVLRDLARLKKPDVLQLTRKNAVLPFDDAHGIEFLCTKNDCALFLLGNHSKKRPHNLVLGRVFDGQLLDMVELGAANFASIDSFAAPGWTAGAKPCFCFQGAEWDSDDELATLRNLLLDFFRGRVVSRISLPGLEHAIVVSVDDARRVSLRHYNVLLKKSGTRIPRIELQESGPSVDLTLRRVRAAAPDVMRAALKVPRELKPKKQKNVSTNEMRDREGNIHMQRQDLNTLALRSRKMKGLKRSRDAADADDDDVDVDDDEPLEFEDDDDVDVDSVAPPSQQRSSSHKRSKK